MNVSILVFLCRVFGAQKTSTVAICKIVLRRLQQARYPLSFHTIVSFLFGDRQSIEDAPFDLAHSVSLSIRALTYGWGISIRSLSRPSLAGWRPNANGASSGPRIEAVFVMCFSENVVPTHVSLARQ